MTDEEKKAWEELIEQATELKSEEDQYGYGVRVDGLEKREVYAILAAAAELTALRAEVERLKGVIEWACDTYGPAAFTDRLRRRAYDAGKER